MFYYIKNVWFGALVGLLLITCLGIADFLDGNFTAHYSTGSEKTVFELVNNQVETFCLTHKNVSKAELYNFGLRGYALFLVNYRLKISCEIIMAAVVLTTVASIFRRHFKMRLGQQLLCVCGGIIGGCIISLAILAFDIQTGTTNFQFGLLEPITESLWRSADLSCKCILVMLFAVVFLKKRWDSNILSHLQFKSLTERCR